MQTSSAFFKNNFLSESRLTEQILFTENLAYYKGFGLSPNVRLFIFKHQPGAFSINLITQTLRDNCIAIVPPRQLHFLSPVNCSDYICIEVPQNVLIDEDFGFMTRLMYSTQKYLNLDKITGFNYSYFHSLIDQDVDYQVILQLLKSKLEKSYPNRLGKIEEPDENYITVARHFETILENIDIFTIDNTIISPYTQVLDCSEKSLYRACKAVFNVSPKNILKHHLLLRTIPLLFNRKYSVELVAQKLGYSSFSAFARFIKAHTDITPGKIRKQLESAININNHTD